MYAYDATIVNCIFDQNSANS